MVVFGVVVNVLVFVQLVDIDELMKLGLFGDKIFGEENVLVMIVEYVFMICGYCVNFYKGIYKDLKKDYIEIGKVCFIFCEFLLDLVVLVVFMLVCCVLVDKYFEIVDIMFEQQCSWVFFDNLYNLLFDFFKQIGFIQELFEECLINQGLFDVVMVVRECGVDVFGVNLMLIFFINGEKVMGVLLIDEMGKFIDVYF